MAVPIIALDVDGVINSFPTSLRKDEKPVWDDLTAFSCPVSLHGGTSFTITHSPTVINRLLEMHTSGQAEIRWLTTWGSEANLELSKGVGFPGDFEVIAERPQFAAYTPLQTTGVKGDDGGWWKLTAFKQLAADNPDRKIIWIDDDLAYDRHAVEFVKNHEGHVLGICPETDYGLTPEHLSRIAQFVAD